MHQIYLRGSALLSLLFIFITGLGYAQVSTYSFSQSTGSYTPITGGTVVATATGTSGAASLDDVVYTLPNNTIPFTFTFDGTGYNTCRISTNGFITFGTTAPAASGSTTGYTPISATTAYAGAASILGRNLNAYFFSGNASQTGEIRYQTLGSSPSRIFVIQFKNFKTFNTSGATFGPVINMQIRLKETTNAIDFVYSLSGAHPVSLAQVGLRGPNNSFPLNVNNRSIASGVNTWTTSAAGTANTSSAEFSGSLLPPSGLFYTFTPVLCTAPQNLLATNITQTTAQLTWTSSQQGNTFRVEYGPLGFTPGTGTVVNNAVSPLNISGLTQNTNYSFYVQQNCGANGLSNVSGPSPFKTGVAGEDCATALTVPVATSLANCNYTTVTSGVSSNGPNALCSDATGNVANDDRWYKFTAPTNGNKIVITTNAGTVNDWVMEVWSACNGIAIKCGDDENGFMPEITLCQNEYVAGQVYYIRTWTYSQTANGNMTMCVYQAPPCPIPPVNDNCIDAIRVNVQPPLSCPGAAQTFSNVFATINSDAASCDASQKRDVYFVFNTGMYPGINIRIVPLTATTLKAQIVFECGSFEVDCFNPANGTYPFSGFNPVADYILRVWSDSGTAGTFSICISGTCANPTATLSGSQSICTGSAAALSVAFTGTPPYSFVYTNGTQNTTINTSNNPHTFNVSPTANTTYSLVSMSDATCAGAVSGTATINVITPQNATLNPFSSICSNAAPIILTGGSPAGGVYSGVNVANGSFNPSGGTQTITYTVTYAPGCTRSASQSYPVLTAPNATLGSLGTVCNTAPAFTLTGGSPAGGMYSGNGVSNNQFNPAVAGVGTHVIYYTYTAANGCSDVANNNISVISCTSACTTPPIANAGVDKNICFSTSNVSISGSISGSASSAAWSGGTGTYSPNNTSLNITYTPSTAERNAGFARLILTTNDPDGSGPCIADKDTMFVYINAVPNLSNINGTTILCRPASGLLYSVTAQNGVNYNWTVPANYTITGGQGTNSITVNLNASALSGTIAVTGSNNCGTSSKNLAITVRTAVPTRPDVISGLSSVCRNDSFPYTIQPVANADFYMWYPPVGATINGSSSPVQTTSTTVTVLFGPNFSGDTLKVRSGNCKGLSWNYRNLAISRRTKTPTTPQPVSGLTTNLCGVNSVTYSVNPVNGAKSYTWRSNIAGALINGQSGNVTTTATSVIVTYPSTWIQGNLYVKANNACGSSNERNTKVSAVPAKPGAISGPGNVCTKDTVVYSIAAVPGATGYTWTIPAGISLLSGQNTTAVTLRFNNTPTTRTIRVAANNACGSSNQTTKSITSVSCVAATREGLAEGFNIDVYPNPVKDLLNITLSSGESGDFFVKLYDMEGRIVRNIPVPVIEGSNSISLEVTGLRSGLYLLHVEGQSESSQVRIMIE